ncbi:hypothetical protein RU97_GL000547 [Enterococcus canis]|uniref:Integral membrane protein n=2 Tax=Enterococcus canis TaxID=214095 RepID=A0A1L8RKR6_9ENTE|nr:DUF624 domain-containing protein [Enterococcus canis]OJG20314.1 hypothetical protein RU97_GL000547 [Enterococcus canis]
METTFRRGDTTMKFNPDSSFFKGITLASQFIALNFLFILSCLPVLTIGAATAAMLDVSLRYADHEQGYLLKGYFNSFIKNWRRATIIFACFGVPIVLLVLASFFWFSLQNILGTIIGLLAAFIAVYFFICWLVATSLVVRYETPIKQLLKNALLLPIAHPVKIGALFLIPLTLFCLMILMPGFKIPILSVGFAFSFYCSAFLLLSVFQQHS